MIILTIRTDKPEAEIGLYGDKEQLGYATWHAHRELGETIHLKIDEILTSQQKSMQDIGGIVVFKGPGSFTGLRIGISVANALADSLKATIIGTEGADWLERGIEALQSGASSHIVVPEYGSDPHITLPKH